MFRAQIRHDAASPKPVYTRTRWRETRDEVLADLESIRGPFRIEWKLYDPDRANLYIRNTPGILTGDYGVVTIHRREVWASDTPSS
jgi:hypothetical protein